MNKSNFLHFLNEKKLFFIFFAIILIVCTVFCLYISQYFSPLTQYEKQLSPGILQDENVWDIYTFHEGEKTDLHYNDGIYEGLAQPGDTYYMSRVITEQLSEQDQNTAILALTLTGEYVSVFLEDDLIYTDYPMAGNQIGSIEFPEVDSEEFILQRTVYVSLPPESLGKALTIAHSEPLSPLPNGGVYTNFVKLTTIQALESYPVATTAKNFTPLVLLLAAAIILFFLFLLRLYYKKQDWSLLLLALAALLWSITFAFFLPAARSWSHAIPGRYEDYISALFSVPILVYLCIKLKKYRKWSILLLAAFIAIVLINRSGLIFMQTFIEINKLAYILSALQTFIYICFLYLCLMEWQKKYASRTRVLKRIGLGILIAIIICVGLILFQTAASDILGSIFSSSFMILQEIVAVAIFCFAIIMTIYDFVQEAAQKKIDMEVLLVRETAANEGYKNLSLYTDQVSMIRHDIRNHLFVVDSMLKSKKWTEAEEYMKNLVSQDARVTPIIRTHNNLIDMILNSKLIGIAELGIELELAVDVPESLSIADSDLNSILANTLDNAISALKLLPEDADKSLSFKMHVKNGFMFVSVKNTYDPTKKPATDLSEPASYHGYGLRIIEKTAKKYDGVVKVQKDQHAFEISIAIKITNA